VKVSIPLLSQGEFKRNHLERGEQYGYMPAVFDLKLLQLLFQDVDDGGSLKAQSGLKNRLTPVPLWFV
jgi:hypothetical protein